ncbi:hypothetical protein WA588_000022 [Blastocystis sp. NMH]
MSDYPQDLIELAPYLEIATELQSGNNNAKALSYWARWYWAKKAGEIYAKCGQKPEVGNYLSTQVGLVQQLKNAVPVLTQPDGKKMVQKFIADDRKEIQALESAGNYQEAVKRWNRHIRYLDVALFSQPDVPQFGVLLKKAKIRMIQIAKSIENNEPVPPMTQSVASPSAGASSFSPASGSGPLNAPSSFVSAPSFTPSSMPSSFSPSAPSSFNPSAPSSFSPSEPSSFAPSASSFSPSAPSSFTPSAPSSFTPSAPSSFSPSGPSSFSPSAPSSFTPSEPSSFAPSAPSSFNPSEPSSFAPSAPSSFSPSVPSFSPSAPSSFAPSAPSSFNPSEPSSFNPSAPSSFSPSASSMPSAPSMPSVPSVPSFTPSSFDTPSMPSLNPFSMPQPTATPSTSFHSPPPFSFPSSSTDLADPFKPSTSSHDIPSSTPSGGIATPGFDPSNPFPPYFSKSQNAMSSIPQQPSFQDIPQPASRQASVESMHSSGELSHTTVNNTLRQSLDNVKTGWENNTEKMLTLYDQAAKSMKASSPKIAKALYDAMIEACQRDQRFQRFIPQFQGEISQLKL